MNWRSISRKLIRSCCRALQRRLQCCDAEIFRHPTDAAGAGHDFTDRDDAEAPPVVIVNQEFVRRFYCSEQNVMGFRFLQGTPLMEIIGIAKDVR